VVVNTAVDNHAGNVPDAIRVDYLASHEGDRFVESMKYVRRYPQELPALADLLPQTQLPVTVLSGRHDHVVPLTNATFLVNRLPHGRSVVLDAGHFVWEEAPEQYVAEQQAEGRPQMLIMCPACLVVGARLPLDPIRLGLGWSSCRLGSLGTVDRKSLRQGEGSHARRAHADICEGR
jgi:hypothetical protein